MRFQTDRIQSLIAEIEAVLGKNSKSRLGWLVGEATEERQVLERVGKYLQNLQEELEKVENSPQPNSQAQPVQLQAELAALQQQRQALIAEIEELEQKRQDYLSSSEAKAAQEQIIAEFSQALIDRLQENVTEQVAITLSRIKETQLVNKESSLETETGLQTTQVFWPTQILPQISEQNLVIDALFEPQQKLTAELGVALPYAGIELKQEIIESTERSQLLGQERSAEASSEETYPDKTREKELSFDEEQDIDDRDILNTSVPAFAIEDVPIPTVLRSDTITALTDLLENTAINGAESVTPASPGDELLAKDELKENQNLDLWQSENVVELNEDLSSLEELDAADVQQQADVLETTDELKSSIDSDLTAAIEQQRRNYSIPEHILAEFDDLFGDDIEEIDPPNDSDTESELTQPSVSDSNPATAEKKN